MCGLSDSGAIRGRFFCARRRKKSAVRATLFWGFPDMSLAAKALWMLSDCWAIGRLDLKWAGQNVRNMLELRHRFGLERA
jgi:hypothetical protein